MYSGTWVHPLYLVGFMLLSLSAFSGVHVTQSLLFCIVFCRLLFVFFFSPLHWLFFFNYCFWLPLRYLQTFNKTLECLKIPIYLPTLGNIIIYSILHCGQATLAVLFPFCFSSIHRCKQYWWTHFVVPLHIQGWTQPASVSSSSVAKHTQQAFLHKKNLQNITWNKLYKK